MCRESWWGHCPWIVFSQIYFTFFMIYASRLSFCEPFFQCGLLCLFFVVVFFSQPDVVNITWITGHIHRSIVDKIDTTTGDVEMVKKKNTLPFTLLFILGYIFLWNMIRRIYLPCLQLISKKYFRWTVISSKVEEWPILTFVMENCLLDLFAVLDLDLEPIWMDNSWVFWSLKSWS
jgi:hypothetical protein